MLYLPCPPVLTLAPVAFESTHPGRMAVLWMGAYVCVINLWLERGSGDHAASAAVCVREALGATPSVPRAEDKHVRLCRSFASLWLHWDPNFKTLRWPGRTLEKGMIQGWRSNKVPGRVCLVPGPGKKNRCCIRACCTGKPILWWSQVLVKWSIEGWGTGDTGGSFFYWRHWRWSCLGWGE